MEEHLQNSVISTGGSTPASRDGEICPRPRSEPHPRLDPSTPLRSARDDSDIDAFALIELLVVIAIIALLMAILVPTLRRVRNQGRAVVCQSNLKQWGTFMAASLNDNGGRFWSPDWGMRRGIVSSTVVARSGWIWGLDRLTEQEAGERIICCPMAPKFVASEGPSQGPGDHHGGTFVAFCGGTAGYVAWTPYGCDVFYGSYGLSSHVGWNQPLDVDEFLETRIWRTADIRGRGRIPVLLDSASRWCVSYWDNPGPTPPECDAIPTVYERQDSWRNVECINRHDGGVNVLFMDWSLRKVGLKELWTLQWHRAYETRGQWTQAGGAEPGDWPKWMRGFKDY